MPSAIGLTLYGPNDERVGELRRLVVPWGILKRAVRLGRLVHMGEVYDLLAEFYGVQREELERGASAAEMLACVQAILGKARALTPRADTRAGAAEANGAEEPGSGLETWILEIERDLVMRLHWSLYELDRTDIESLFPLLFQRSGGGVEAPVPAQVYADQVDWL